jgi:2-C-methyl-D-erythritol 4-phosphate cytidylyltransferase
MDQMNVSVIIPAAGAGTRFAQGELGLTPNKVELDLIGKPVFLHAIELFARRQDVGRVILAVSPGGLDDFMFRWGDKLAFMGVIVVAGGETERWQTVAKALDAVDEDATHVAVHDAARPLTTDALIGRVFSAASRFDAVIPGCDVGSTLKRVKDADTQQDEADPLDAILGSAGKDTVPARRVVETVDRRGLVAVQTPQVFEVGLIRRAYQQIAEGVLNPARITDDAQLIEMLGETVHIVEGESTNLKITYPSDAELAEALLLKLASSEAGELAKRRLFGDDDED